MKRFLETKLFNLLSCFVNGKEIDRIELSMAYDDFVRQLLLFCQEEQNIILLCFAINYTVAEVKELNMRLEIENDNSSLEFEFMDMMKENSGGNYMDADSTSGFNAFASGEAAMIVTGEFSLLNAQSINPDLQVGLFGVPLTENEEDAKLDVDVGICIAVNQNTPHLDAVREVLNYLSDNTDENGWMHYSADSMGAAPPAMDFTMSTEYQYFKDYKNYMSNNQTRPWVYSQLVSGAGDMIGPVIQGYFAGTTDMDTTLDQLDSKFSELLE